MALRTWTLKKTIYDYTNETCWDGPDLADDESVKAVEIDCGWVSESHGSLGLRGNRLARREYQEHVEAALGADAYYNAPVACINCGSQHEQGLLVGTDVWSGTCVLCGASGRLRPDGLVESAKYLAG